MKNFLLFSSIIAMVAIISFDSWAPVQLSAFTAEKEKSNSGTIVWTVGSDLDKEISKMEKDQNLIPTIISNEVRSLSVSNIDLDLDIPISNDTHPVLIKWTIESGINISGFNILRSESPTIEFTKINSKLISYKKEGKHEWVDASAKPNILYFYQIEAISLDRDPETLRTTRLKGYVPTPRKATTWGALKFRK